MTRRPLGQILKAKGKVTDEQLQQALEAQKSTAQPLGRTLVDLGYVSELDVAEAYAEQQGVQFVDLTKVQIDESAVALFPQELIHKHEVIPIRIDGNQITVAMSNPRDLVALDDLRMHARRNGNTIRPVFALGEQIKKALESTSGVGGDSGGGGGAGLQDINVALKEFEQASTARKGKVTVTTQLDLASTGLEEALDKAATEKDMADEAPIIRIMNVLFREAIRVGASDIHIEPQRKDVRIRFRIDGILHEIMRLPKFIAAPLISRVKILGDMDIAERRIPQDGRIRLSMGKKTFDVRVSTIPVAAAGEKAVMRILDQSTVQIGLEKLGLFPDDMAKIEYLLEQPNGMILSTGPTGSGKTTTQYSMMHKLNRTEVNIITIEDPIEYQLPGLNQVHVNRKAGLTFATAIRSFLRQDPDIIMVGEIRDLETADIAIQAALTGHLVLSTLHTNDAPTTVTRLVDMGVEPFLIAASLLGAIAQRLARRICTNCKEPYQPAPEVLARFGYEGGDGDVVFHRGRGCEVCRGTGYKGRIGIFEMFLMNSEISDLVIRRAPLSEIRDAAIASGMKTLLQDGFRKVLAGITTPEEVLRVVATAGY